MFEVDGKKILIVDDYKENVDILVEALIDKYQVYAALNGSDALKLADKVEPDLILLDIMMPVMDGYETIRNLKGKDETKEIPVIFISALSEISNKKRGFDLGAVDYITKPFDMLEVEYRVKIHLTLREANKYLENQNHTLEEKVRERTKENENLRDAMIETLADLAETRDSETGNHIKRTQHYIRIVARSLYEMGLYKDIITDDYLELLFKTSPLHDVGKVGIRDEILLKPGKLTDEEFEEMKNHAYLGYKILHKSNVINANLEFINLAAEIAYSHHEKWDGSGYPRKLKGEEIPLSGRLMAIVDVYDALVSKRIYKEGMGHEEAKEIILKGKGIHFQPEVVEAFLNAENELIEVRKHLIE